jgi:hypothetical protein
MSSLTFWKTGTSVLVVLGLTSGTIVPLIAPVPAIAQTTFPDVPAGYWAEPFIQALVARGVIAGFPEDGTFRPEEPVTRAQFAAMINKAFNRPPVQQPVNFPDVPAGYWGAEAIQRAYITGFMAGYNDGTFRPNENIPRAQVLVALASGLNYASTAPVESVLTAYRDVANIPAYARPGIAAATERRVVVNYPDVGILNPNRVATRAEVAALIYQGLVSTGQVAAIPSPYIIGGAPPVAQVRIPAGTALPVRYDGAERILLAPNEPQPLPLTLKITQNIVDSGGRVLIPAGSEVVGQVQMVQGGAQFTASQITFPNGQRLPMSASSEVISKTEAVRRGTNAGNIVIGTVVGAGAGAGIAAVTGDREIQAWEVLTGAAAGAILGTISASRGQVELISIDPNTDLSLTLNADLTLPQ